MAPCYTLMEVNIFERMAKYIGWEAVDGVLTPGGSFANFNAMILARFYKFPEVKTKGMSKLPEMRVYTSEHSHYSFDKGAITLGLGTDSVVKVPCHSNGRMDPEALERLIQEDIGNGYAPIMINSTISTTVVACIDPVEEIAKIAKKYDIWHHADGALGGAALLPTSVNHLVKGGSSMLDSVTWDPHKCL